LADWSGPSYKEKKDPDEAWGRFAPGVKRGGRGGQLSKSNYDTENESQPALKTSSTRGSHTLKFDELDGGFP